MGWKLWVMGYGLWVMGYGLTVRCFRVFQAAKPNSEPRTQDSGRTISSHDQRQPHPKRRPLVRLAFDLDDSLVRLDDPPDDREPEPGSARIRAAGAVAAEEALEDVRAVAGGNSDSR